MDRKPTSFRVYQGGKGLESSGGGGDSTDMEARVAVLEQIAKSTAEVLKEIRGDLKEQRAEAREGVAEQRRNQERDFRLTWGGMITIALGLAALMAKGFKWF